MRPVSEAELVDLARRWSSERRPWHHHVLDPGCRHNPGGGHLLMLEEDVGGAIYTASTDGFPEADTILVTLLHGDSVLDVTQSGQVESTLIDVVDRLAATSREWHHHMHFPTCRLNPAPGTWTIAIESGEESWHDSWPDEPLDVLREIELRYFAGR